ncbi:MAG: N-6 DNA methylase, partial [Kiritimatiellaeota bacterium]|nr:N-6 DNA methylase [Kiritimatiellota bacterium]
MRRSNCAGALQYVPELTWILFLRILDEREMHEAEAAAAVKVRFAPSLKAPYRWQDWAAPPMGGSPSSATETNPRDETSMGGSPSPATAGGTSSTVSSSDGVDAVPPMEPRRTAGMPSLPRVPPKGQGWKRKELQDGALGAFIGFVNGALIPHLKALRDQPNATPRQKVMSEIFSGVERTRIDTERNLLDVLDKVHEISAETVDPTHVFTVSQVYEGLLLKMGEKGNDGGQFFTPREIIRAMVRVIDPQIGETVYDPGCGTGGFLAQAFEHMAGRNNEKIKRPDQLETIKRQTFYGREKDNATYPIALANLVLHNIDEPHIWHGNTLTGAETYGGLFTDAPALYNVVLMNPPFGGKEGKEAQTKFTYKTGATQVLFLQHVLDSLKPGGRCGIVLDEGVLFRTNETAFVQTKRKLLDDCNLWCIVSLPGGVFTAAGAGVKTNLLFFVKGQQTEKIWYYDLSDLKTGKRTPFTIAHFEEFFRLLPQRSDSAHSWSVDMVARRDNAKREAVPFRAEAEKITAAAETVREHLKALKTAKQADSAAYNALTEKLGAIEREA